MQLVHFKSYHDESNGFHDNRNVYGMLPPPLDPYTRHMISQWLHGSSGLSLGTWEICSTHTCFVPSRVSETGSLFTVELQQNSLLQQKLKYSLH